MESKGLFDVPAMMQSPALAQYVTPSTDGSVSPPLQYIPVLPSNADRDQPDATFDVLLHKNSESLANAVFFQMHGDLAEYDEVRHRAGGAKVIVDPFLQVERTLDRCAIYNDLSSVFPIGYDPHTYVPLDDCPLPVCLPHSVLVYQPLVKHHEDAQHQPPPVWGDRPVGLPLLPCHALSIDELGQYPPFYDNIGKDCDESTTTPDQHHEHRRPTVLCIKPVLSSGSSVAHAMILTHNAVPAAVSSPSPSSSPSPPTTSTTTPPPTQYVTPPTLRDLPAGLHHVSQVCPHDKVYKVYVINGEVSIEIRDSVDVTGMHQARYLAQRQMQIQVLVELAQGVLAGECTFDDLVTQYHIFSQMNAQYQQFRREDQQRVVLQGAQHGVLASGDDDEDDDDETPSYLDDVTSTPLYFNSQYMQMFPLRLTTTTSGGAAGDAATGGDFLHEDHLTETEVENYLTRIINGTAQPLLGMFPNRAYFTPPLPPGGHEATTTIPGHLLYPSIDELFPATPSTAHSIAPQVTMPKSMHTITPPYFPSAQLLSHLYAENALTTTKAWGDHSKVRKLLKTLWALAPAASSEPAVEICMGVVVPKTTTTAAAPPGVLPRHDIPQDILQSAKAAAAAIQANTDLTLFGFDVVQHRDNKALFVIDVNFFPSFTSVSNLPVEMAAFLLATMRAHGEQQQ